MSKPRKLSRIGQQGLKFILNASVYGRNLRATWNQEKENRAKGPTEVRSPETHFPHKAGTSKGFFLSVRVNQNKNKTQKYHLLFPILEGYKKNHLSKT